MIQTVVSGLFCEHAGFESLGIFYIFCLISIFLNRRQKKFPVYKIGLFAFGTSVTLVKTTVYRRHVEITNTTQHMHETWRQVNWASPGLIM